MDEAASLQPVALRSGTPVRERRSRAKSPVLSHSLSDGPSVGLHSPAGISVQPLGDLREADRRNRAKLIRNYVCLACKNARLAHFNGAPID
jgi:hypothetical protein